MKYTLFCFFVLGLAGALPAQTRSHQQGTIVRMSMTDCGPQRGFMAAMSGTGKGDTSLPCPEYVLVTDKVVYVISGKTSDQLLPLAEVTRFRLKKNEMLIRIDDSDKESHFHIKVMVLRPDWDRSQMLEEAAATSMMRRHMDPTVGEEQ